MVFYNNKRYNNFGGYLKKKFGEKVYKVCIDAGFNCPNRDGLKGHGGCIYCNNDSFKPRMTNSQKTVYEQLVEGIEYQKKRFKGKKFIAYFQPYSNTYDQIDVLSEFYNQALSHPDVVGLSVGTRPDCITPEVLDLLEELAEKTHLWIEYGLQTMHNSTLDVINRKHTFDDFHHTYMETRKRKNIHICVHVIHGLPYETKEMMLQTVQYLSDLGIDGIKIHQLHVVKNTKLEKIYNRGEFTLPTLDDYLDLVAQSLEILSPDVVIQRLFGLGPLDILIAPDWNMRKGQFNTTIDNYLERVDSWQGKRYKKPEPSKEDDSLKISSTC